MAGSSRPPVTLEKLAKQMQDMMAGMTAMHQDSKAQTEELKARLENTERSHLMSSLLKKATTQILSMRGHVSNPIIAFYFLQLLWAPKF